MYILFFKVIEFNGIIKVIIINYYSFGFGNFGYRRIFKKRLLFF